MSKSEAKANKEMSVLEKDNTRIVPQLLNELKVNIFAHVPCTQYWKMLFINKSFSRLLQSKDIFKVRKERGLVKPYVLILTTDNNQWTMFDGNFETFQRFPEIASDYCFLVGDKETICAGTHMIVVGRELESDVVWRFEVETNKWFKGPSMITPRSMYGSATRGTEAFFAGGIKSDEKFKFEVVNVGEKYNSETKTWTSIRAMHVKRRNCSGCFFRGKFYVIGGKDENDEYLTSGESYDEATDSWELIPNMLQGMSIHMTLSPPLIAVVNDNLYFLETCFNELHVYNKDANTWKELGVVPVRADAIRGWGVAFKSLGDRLLLAGATTAGIMSATMSVYTCRPSTNIEDMVWERINIRGQGRVRFSHFISNCCVMYA